MLTHEREPFLRVVAALPDEVRVPAKHGQGHAGGAENDADRQPVHIVLVVDTTSAGTAPHGVDEEALLLVEAQGVNAQPGAFGDLPDAQTRGVLHHAAQRNGVDLEGTLVPRVPRAADASVARLIG